MTEIVTKPLMTTVDYLKQWMLDPNHQHRPLRPMTPFSSPDDHTHSLLNQRTRTFLRRQQTSGVHLGETAATVTRWFFTRASEDHSPLRYGEPVAMGYGTNPAYLHCQRHSVGADLAWSDQPSFEWELLGRGSGQPARSGDWLALYNRERGDCLTYFEHAVGGDIGWPSSETWSGPPRDTALRAVQQHWDEALIWLLAA